jgi:hypothetical protein
MRLILQLLFFCLLSTAAFGSQAQLYSGNRLHEICKSDPAFASAYVAGVIDARLMSKSTVEGLGNHLKLTSANVSIIANTILGSCLKPEMTLGQFRDVVCKYLVENAALRHNSASELVANALDEAFPCK